MLVHREAARRVGDGCCLAAWLTIALAACTLDANPAALHGLGRLPLRDEDAGMTASTTPDTPPLSGDGAACAKNEECASQHCQHEICCREGECCNSVDDCPGASMGITCEKPASCQGVRGVIACTEHRCTAAMSEDDDSACTKQVEASDCGPYPSVFCNGKADQQAPRCADSCRRDSNCDPSAHCDDTCVPDVQEGEACDEDSDCEGGHCNHGICCESGDCCRKPADCPATYAFAARCDDVATCQGTRADATCEHHSCGTKLTQDDSACDGQLADACGAATDSLCTAEVDQPIARCANGCKSDAECDEGAHCDGTCILRVPNGTACSSDAACESAHCQNGFCCEAGDCCRARTDCPRRYEIPAICADYESCMGYHWEATCSFSSCWSRPIVDGFACGFCTPAQRQ